MWDVENGECKKATVLHSDEVTSLASFGRDHVLSCSYDGLLRLWNPERNRVLVTLEGHEGRVCCQLVNESRVVSGCWDSSIKVWELPLFL